MNLALTRTQPRPLARVGVVLFPFVLAALVLGIWASSSPSDWIAPIAIALLIAIGAWAMPLRASVLVLVGIIPFQLYLVLPGTTLTFRVAALFSYAIALRVLPLRSASFWARWRGWLPPIGLFVGAALAGAWGASNRYLAVKGLYDWLPFFATFFVMIQVSEEKRLVRQVCVGIIAGGVAEGLVGLAQYLAGLDSVVGFLHLPLAQIFYQPDLLQERLVDLSFNWVSGGRVLPFGTFINSIDFAVYMAAALSLALAFVAARFSESPHTGGHNAARTVGLYVAALPLGTALVLTLKGSGLLAVAGGLAVVGICWVRSLTRRTVPAFAGIVAVCVVCLLALWSPLSERIMFLVEREQGLAGTIGRLAIWSQLLEHLVDRPWFGFGMNNAILIAEPTRTLSGGAFALISTSPESAPVALLVETGIIGFIALCLLFGIAIVRAYSATNSVAPRRLAVGVLAAIVSILLGNLTVSGLTTDQNGMLLGLLVGMAGGAWNRQ